MYNPAHLSNRERCSLVISLVQDYRAARMQPILFLADFLHLGLRYLSHKDEHYSSVTLTPVLCFHHQGEKPLDLELVFLIQALNWRSVHLVALCNLSQMMSLDPTHWK